MSSDQFCVCSTCRTAITFGQDYFQCSVSTCNRSKTALYFCSVPCWDAHVPMMRHRDAWAEAVTAPTREQLLREEAAQREREAQSQQRKEDTTERRRRVVSGDKEDFPKDVLVVVSKLKNYVRARSGMNTSDSVTSPLSDHLRKLCDAAARHAAEDGRKTVLDRDFAAVLKALGGG
jgi:histone H3/H4